MFYTKEKLKAWMILLCAVSAFGLSSCSQQQGDTQNGTTAQTTDTTQQATNETRPMNVTKEVFGKTEDGTEVHLYTLTNDNGMTVKITNYGAIITSLVTKDKNGNPGDIVLGFDSLESYLKGHPFFGAVAGRYANRIKEGKFTLDGKEYKLATNNGKNHLHGGIKGFDKVVWTPEEINNGLKLTYKSKDMEEGYPGNLTATVTYVINDNNELRINYTAETDKPTPVNLTNHSYFNLAAGQAKNNLDHVMFIQADKYTVVDETMIPTGELRPVKGTPFDFTTPQPIGARIEQTGGGYDHNFVLIKKTPGEMSLAATVYEPTSGRVMEVYTTQPGVQFYAGNFLDGSLTGKGGVNYVKRYGFCLETQHFPDSPNQAAFPSTILKPGETYKQATIFKFSAENRANQ
ncbi:aldose epimerase family protein [Rhodocytophaga aerolata]